MALAVIRADASASIGLGHLMRCRSLALQLQSRGYEIVYLCSELPSPLIEDIEVRFDSRVRLIESPVSHPEDHLAECISVLERLKPHRVIVDHYGLDAAWESEVQRLGVPLLAIDDLADRPHSAEWLLDQNYGASIDQYSACAPEGVRFLLGPRYALLRSEFLAARAKMRPEHFRFQSSQSSPTILVNLGGSDPLGLTAPICRSLGLACPEAKLIVILGIAAESAPELESLPNTQILRSVNNISEWMLQANLAIGAGGSSTWERLCLGLPAITLTVAQNQMRFTYALERDGYLVAALNAQGIGRIELADRVATIASRALKAPELLQKLSARGMELVDGQGARRVAHALTESDEGLARYSGV